MRKRRILTVVLAILAFFAMLGTITAFHQRDALSEYLNPSDERVWLFREKVTMLAAQELTEEVPPKVPAPGETPVTERQLLPKDAPSLALPVDLQEIIDVVAKTKVQNKVVEVLRTATTALEALRLDVTFEDIEAYKATIFTYVRGQIKESAFEYILQTIVGYALALVTRPWRLLRRSS